MSDDIYKQFEARIRGNRLDSLLARWECGQQLNTERADAGRLPNGRLEQLSNTLGVSRSELNNRMRFAASHLSKEDVETTLTVHKSWYAICRDCLKARLTDDEPEDGLPELESTKLYDAVRRLQGPAHRFMMHGLEEPNLDLILCDRRYLDPPTIRTLFNAFGELRNRLAHVMEALKWRMDVKMDERLDSLSGDTLLDRIKDGSESVAVGESDT
jgi:hypothetical protein